MQYITFTLPVVALLAAGVAVAQNTLTVNTPPTLITCQPAALSWTGGTAPYYPRITEGGNIAATLLTFDTTSSTQITWTVNIAAGTTVTIAVSDSTGAAQGSAEVTINPGATDCLNDSTTVASTGTSTGTSTSASTSASSTTSSSVTSSAPATTTRPTSSSSSTTRTSSADPSSTSAPSSGAESVRGFAAAVAGVVGIVAAALL